MSRWKDDKDLGPWEFTEQPDKYGYLNNKRWSSQQDAQEFCEDIGLSLDPTHTHKPCGHWHKREPVSSDTSLAIRLLSCGNDNYGQLGLGIDGTAVGGIADFVQLGIDTWIAVAAGLYFSFAIKNDGTLWATGRNNYGQLGLGDTTDRDELAQVGSGTTWVAVACGSQYTIAIKSDGTMWATGRNNKGQLGLNDTSDRNSFAQIAGTGWEHIECGYDFSVARKTDHTLWATGENGDGQLGLGDTTDRDEFEQIGSDTNWDDFSCGYSHLLAIKTTKTLWATGDDWYGQLGLNYSSQTSFTQVGSDSDWSDVSCGDWHTIAIKSTGAMYGAGSDYYGELGLNNGPGVYAEYSTFTQISASGWEKIFCGPDYSIAIKTDGSMWGTGRNEYGQHGRGDYGIKYIFTEILSDFSIVDLGLYHTIAIMDDGMLWVAGYNNYGAISLSEHHDYTDIFTALDGEDWRQVDTWNDHDLAVKTDAAYAVHGCGYNYYGQLGLDDHNINENINLRYLLTEIQLAGVNCETEFWLSNAVCGEQHSAVLDSSGHIWTTGYNTYGQLGHGDTTTRYALTQISSDVYIMIAAGSTATMAIKEDGTLWVCGQNSGTRPGLLGLNDTTDRHTLTQELSASQWSQVSIGV